MPTRSIRRAVWPYGGTDRRNALVAEAAPVVWAAGATDSALTRAADSSQLTAQKFAAYQLINRPHHGLATRKDFPPMTHSTTATASRIRKAVTAGAALAGGAVLAFGAAAPANAASYHRSCGITPTRASAPHLPADMTASSYGIRSVPVHTYRVHIPAPPKAASRVHIVAPPKAAAPGYWKHASPVQRKYASPVQRKW
jgi:hypothetical protein